jgi:thiol-disulfide isomerase/thioredoxin
MSRCFRPQLAIVMPVMIAASAHADQPDPAALVRQVRQRESWIERVDSIELKALIRWQHTPRGVEHRRRELEAQFPNVDVAGFRDLRVGTRQVVEMAYDKARVRLRVEQVGDSEDLRIWDGKRFVLRSRYDESPDRNGILIDREPERQLPWVVWSHFDSFRSGAHRFWWNGPKQQAEVAALTAKPEDFAYEGTAEFRGTKCHVVSHWDSWTSLYIAVDDGSVRGMRSGAQTTRKLKRSFIELLRRKGYQVQDEADSERVSAGIPRNELAAIFRAGASELTRLIDPCFEYWLSDEKEVAPGCWLPMTQGMRLFQVDDDGNAFESQRHDLKIVEVKVNERLRDSLFAIEFKEGEQINDQTSEPPVSYRYKKNMSLADWATIVAEGKERAALRNARKKKPASLLGRDAFEFPASASWLSSKPLSKKDLAGKIVILHFWAEWSGPCRNDLVALAAQHKKNAKDVVVIGVHPPGSELEVVKKITKEFELGYPICIDVAAPDDTTTWGALHEAYGVSRIPHSVVIDRQGQIAAAGALADSLARATELAGHDL